MKKVLKHQVLRVFSLPLFVSKVTRSIVYVLDGKCTVKRFSLIKDFREGDVFFINTNEVVSITSEYGCIVEWIDFDVELLNRDNNSLFYLLDLMDAIGSMDQQKNMAETYRDCVFTKNLLSIETAKDKESCFQEIAEALIADYHEFSHNDYISKEQIEWILAIRKNIVNNLKEKVSLQDIAESVNMKKSNLATQYKQLTGMTLLEWIHIQRLKKAEEMLLFTDKSHQEIIKECGFSDSKYFYRYFMEQFYMTPAAWKEAMKKDVVRDVEVLGEKEKLMIVTKVQNELSGLKTDTDLYKKARWIRELRKQNLLFEDTVVEVDLLHGDNYIDVANQRMNAWYGFDLLMNELRQSFFEVELCFDWLSKRNEDVDELFDLLRKSFLHFSSKVLKCCKFVIVFHSVEEVAMARNLQKRLLKEFKLDVVVKCG